MFIHDVIKIKYIREGYLPDKPYRMLPDSDMFGAFLSIGGFFEANYPCPDESLQGPYTDLKNQIIDEVSQYLTEGKQLEPWIYSYMLGAAIGPQSDATEIEYLNTLMNLNIPVATDFTKETAEEIYQISQDWLRKISYKYIGRVPTIFGEPYIIKALRLNEVDVLGG